MDNIDFNHNPVLLKESVDGLTVKKDRTYVDCNLGGGGHTSEILNRGGKVVGIDIDENAVNYCKNRFSAQIENSSLIVVKDNFVNLDGILQDLAIKDVSGILFDLGVSTFQLKDEKKGFSFEDDEPLDMRMSSELGVSAHDLICGLSQKELEGLYLEYGEEPQAKGFAKASKGLAKKKPNFTAKDFANTIKNSSKYKQSKTHPATRVFQALRIAVNSELENLRETLIKAIPLLMPGGRLVIISFHSLEDRLAKEIAGSPELMKVNEKPILPSEEEIRINNSSRSAKLRIYEKI